MASKKKSVLFICLGNICRSPMAEAVFLNLLTQKGVRDQWDVDSAALGPWHVGNGPDKRTMQTLKKFGVTEYKHKARTLCDEDYTKYDVIFGMDEENMLDLEHRKPKNSTTKLQKLGEFHPGGELIIRDPYFDDRGDMSGFENVYAQCVQCCENFLKKA